MSYSDQRLMVGRADINVPEFRIDPKYVNDSTYVPEKFDEWVGLLLDVNRQIVGDRADLGDEDDCDQQLILPATDALPLLLVSASRHTRSYKTPDGWPDGPDVGYSTPSVITELVEERTIAIPRSEAASSFMHLYKSSRRTVNGRNADYSARTPDEAISVGDYDRGRYESAQKLLPGIETVLDHLGYGNHLDFEAANMTVGSYLAGLRQQESAIS